MIRKLSHAIIYSSEINFKYSFNILLILMNPLPKCDKIQFACKLASANITKVRVVYMKCWRHGLIDGIPIGLGYLSVSFTFGILAVSYGLSAVQAVLISMTTLTSAGQFAGLSIMCSMGSYLEMLIAQITINLRYALMSISLSQNTEDHFRGKERWFLGSFITDEIFAVAISQKDKVSKSYFSGLVILPYFGWALGTLLGAVLGVIIPETVGSALGIALYGMFIAILIPKMREDSKVLLVILISVVLSSLFHYVPGINKISIGFKITICSVIAAGFGAILFPHHRQEEIEQ